MKRGDIYMAELDPVVGSEQGGTRPVAIIQNDMGNLHSPTVIAVPLTGSTGKPALPTHVHIPRGEGGLWRESIVLCEQVRTLEKTRIRGSVNLAPWKNPASGGVWARWRRRACAAWSGRWACRWI